MKITVIAIAFLVNFAKRIVFQLLLLERTSYMKTVQYNTQSHAVHAAISVPYGELVDTNFQS
jgi:hypothetical protein